MHYANGGLGPKIRCYGDQNQCLRSFSDIIKLDKKYNSFARITHQ